ncbi:MAG: hypothetical protein MUF64_23055, partial [Polyangiaceae bacterium]|nr:hypothetical protein [Polyangiaceae bacterium]
MIAEVGLAGIRLPWRFGRTDALASWLDERPWTVCGGVLSLGVSGPVGSDVIGDVINNSIRQLEGSRFGRDVLVQPCNLDEVPFDAHVQLRSWLELEAVPSSDEGWRATARALADSEHIWLARFRGQQVTESVAALRRAIEMLKKRDARAHATVIVLCEDASTDAQHDMRRGVPLDNPGWMGAPLAHWDRYLHHRLAWESAGELDRAMRWQDAIGSVRAGDDVALEARLTSLAKADWDALPVAVRDEVIWWTPKTGQSVTKRRPPPRGPWSGIGSTHRAQE